VEPVFGNLLHHYGLRRVNTKGQAAAQKVMLLRAVAYNLKKLLKYQPTRMRRIALASQANSNGRKGPFPGYLPAS
jgi:hypothetical protein